MYCKQMNRGVSSDQLVPIFIFEELKIVQTAPG